MIRNPLRTRHAEPLQANPPPVEPAILPGFARGDSRHATCPRWCPRARTGSSPGDFADFNARKTSTPGFDFTPFCPLLESRRFFWSGHQPPPCVVRPAGGEAAASLYCHSARDWRWIIAFSFTPTINRSSARWLPSMPCDATPVTTTGSTCASSNTRTIRFSPRARGSSTCATG